MEKDVNLTVNLNDGKSNNFRDSTKFQNLTRRDFLISLTGSSVALITGYFLFRTVGVENILSSHSKNGSSLFPCLKKEIVFGINDEMVTIYLKNDDSVLCAVNEIGAIIINRLDGRHTVSDISKTLGKKFNIELSESLNAQIANFIAQIGSLGFLRDPFYTTIFFEAVKHS